MKTLFASILALFFSSIYGQQTPQILALEILQNNLPAVDTIHMQGGGDTVVTTVQDYSVDVEMVLVLSDTTGVDEFLFEIYKDGQVEQTFSKVQSDNIRGSIVSSENQNYHFRFRMYGLTLPVGEKVLKAKIKNDSNGVIGNRERHF